MFDIVRAARDGRATMTPDRRVDRLNEGPLDWRSERCTKRNVTAFVFVQAKRVWRL